ncbi:MAG: response regulator transcription factor [Firmicutes bacterium]|nr:response regulator transcription factor [Bacillota bacterium]MBQ6482527.1 response regulator transcription factor [Anaerolineaceae bacterium]
MFVYRKCFKPTFLKDISPHEGERQSTLTNSIPAHGDFQERIREVAEQYNLTKRERELVELIYQGKSNKDIAEELFLSESTVKTHIYNIFRKMNVKNRIEVICIINGEQV